ncbi:recombinase RecT [Paenibacillus lautus]|uniref:recombinase RecT n=1 Tax=Paenibacillus lautus TaxID=1401 RepID=UPI00384F5E17
MTKTDTQIQSVDMNQIQAIGEFGVAELMAMKESIAKKLSVPQFNLFMYQMNRMGLDPSLGHGVPILYGQDVNIRIEYEGWKSLAQKSKGYQGIYSQAIREEDEFSAESDDDGIITKVNFKMGKPPRGKVVGSFSVAKREGHKDVIIVCDLDEFEKYAKKNPSFWKLDNGGIDPDMARKFAATRAVKAQFDVAQVVESNMMALNTGEGEQPAEPTRRDITSEATEHPRNPGTEPVSGDEEARMKKLKSQMKANYTKLELTDKEAMAQHMQQYCKKEGDTPTEAELKEYLKIMDLQIQEKQLAADDLPL